MPFKSKAQARYLFATHPDLARRWADLTSSIGSLPEHVRRRTRSEKSPTTATATAPSGSPVSRRSAGSGGSSSGPSKHSASAKAGRRKR